MRLNGGRHGFGSRAGQGPLMGWGCRGVVLCNGGGLAFGQMFLCAMIARLRGEGSMLSTFGSDLRRLY